MPQLTTHDILAKLSSPEQRQQLLNAWPTIKCGLCKSAAATGIWVCQFSKQSPPYIRTEMKTLCAGCGLTDCYRKWNGFMAPHLLRCDLAFTITCPEGDKRTNADKLIEKLLTHPTGQGYFTAWKLMFRPANIHYPLAPALNTLVGLVAKLFPPNDNKAD